MAWRFATTRAQEVAVLPGVEGRGVLYPARLPSFHRVPAPEAVAQLVRWFWIPRWQLQPGRTSRQEVLAYPASNLTVEPGGVVISGPTTRISHRDLTGTGWAVGALLRPAGVAALGIRPAELTDVEARFEAPGLHPAVVEAMADATEERARQRAVAAYTSWLASRAAEPDESALLANRMEEVIWTERDVVRVEQLAGRLGLSVRSLQRLTDRCIGVPPLAVIRRHRLQEAAQRLREDPGATVAAIAAELGYSDHSHLTHDFRTVLGFTPRSYRGSHPAGG